MHQGGILPVCAALSNTSHENTGTSAGISAMTHLLNCNKWGNGVQNLKYQLQGTQIIWLKWIHSLTLLKIKKEIKMHELIPNKCE
jgi:hypothetical protein